MDLDQRLRDVEDELYGVAPGDFVERRRVASRAAKQDGDRELGDAIAALRKPTAAAWAVNSFVRADRTTIDAVLVVGARLREAVERGDGDEIRTLMRERSRVIGEAMAELRHHLAERGESLSTSVSGQVEQTLRAAMASHEDAELVSRGVLTGAVVESGLDAAVVPATPGPATGPEQAAGDPDDGRLDAERRVATADEGVATTQRELDASVTRRTDLEAERDELRRRLDDVEHRLRDERDVVREIEARLETARAELRAARAALRRRR